MAGLSRTLGLVGERPAEEIVRRLTLDVDRRLDGMLHGDFMGIVPGRGTEPGETREYEPGDDVRHIDWNVTARMQSPHIRQTIADRELETWLLVDRSPGLDFGTASCEKRDLVLAASAAVGLLTARGANRVGAALLCADRVTTVPPRQGRRHLLGILDRILSAPRADGAGHSSLGTGLRRVGAMAPRRGLVAVISDFLRDPDEWRTALGTVALRHAVLCLQVLDPRDVELPPVGLLHLTDPATGATREVNTDDPRLRARYAEAAARQQATIAQAIRGAGADHLVLRTDSDWLLDLARHVKGKRRRAEMAAGRRTR
ncbi:MAG TPA: DUF58 domain-containing protein [Microthrixaceae bacterium]|nr:DUF58 domain-containing protein [Microthrixaceae bacterium]